MRPNKPKIVRSNQIYERAKDIIPAGSQTFSKGVTQFVEGFHRTLLAIYFLPLCFAVIFIAVIFVSLVVDVTS